jgi:hypothetical protein
MPKVKSQAINLLGALIAPFAVEILLSLAIQAVPVEVSPYLVSLLALLAPPTSVGVGFMFLQRSAYRQRVVGGVIYFLVMMFTVVFVTMYFAARLGSAM